MIIFNIYFLVYETSERRSRSSSWDGCYVYHSRKEKTPPSGDRKGCSISDHLSPRVCAEGCLREDIFVRPFSQSWVLDLVLTTVFFSTDRNDYFYAMRIALLLLIFDWSALIRLESKSVVIIWSGIGSSSSVCLGPGSQSCTQFSCRVDFGSFISPPRSCSISLPSTFHLVSGDSGCHAREPW